MDGMTLPSGHKIRNLSPGGLRLSTPPLGYGVTEAPINIEFLRVSGGKKHFVSLQFEPATSDFPIRQL